jgi:SulP family sulfate permease
VSLARYLPPRGAVLPNIGAGLVVGVIALPLSIALAIAVGVSPAAGLYTAIFAGGVAALFGGSNYNITGPTAALVPVLNHAVLRHGPSVLPTLALLAGIILVGFSLIRAGRLVRFIPGTVVVGFTAGIALSIAFGQLNNFLGITGTDPGAEHFHERLADSIAHVETSSAASIVIGILALALLLLWPKIPRASMLPGPLVAVVATTALAWGLDLDAATVGSSYGALPRNLPRLDAPVLDLDLVADLLPLAFAVAVLAGIESLLSAVVADGMSGSAERHDSDRELRGQGLGNLVAACFGGIPATAAIARTAAGIRHGGTSRLTGVTHAFTVLVATVALAPLVGHVPLTALAAILLVVAWNIGEIPEVLKLLRKAPREDAVVLFATMGITLVLDLTYAIGFGVLASMVLLIRRLITVPAAQELLPDQTGRIRQVSPELSDLIASRPDIALFNADGSISFHSAAAFEYELLGHDRNPLILRMKDVHHIDTTGLLTLEGIIEHRQKQGGRIILTAVQPELSLVLARFGLLDKLGPENLFEHTRDAIASIDSPHGRETHPDGPMQESTAKVVEPLSA